MVDYSPGQTWGALRKCWRAYKIAKVQKDQARMKEYAEKVRTLQGQLQVPLAKFPELGLE